ncbi:MAG: hypothetical protein ACRC2S_00660 [Waterburya sp.]
MSQISQDTSNPHNQELKQVIDMLSKITSCSPEEIKPHLDEFVSRLNQKPSPYANHFYKTASDEKWIAAFREWSESHRVKKLPVLSEEAMSRDSIYGKSKS